MSAAVTGGAAAPHLLSMAYIYPQPYWIGKDSEWVKTLLPFFDGVAILLPDYMHGRHRGPGEWVAGPLEDRGLLRVLHPENFVDQEMTRRLSETLLELLDGPLGEVPVPADIHEYQDLSNSRLGWNADVQLSGELVSELTRRKLALPPENPLTIRLHPEVRTAVLVLLSQLAPRRGRDLGLDLQPATPNPSAVAELLSLIERPGMPTAGHVVAFDVEQVGLSLEGVDLDEVLAFRDNHGADFRAYMANVRRFVQELSAIEDTSDRARLFAERQETLRDAAAALRRVQRSYWRQPLARLAVGGLGSAASIASGGTPVVGLVASGASSGLEWENRPTGVAGVFSYLFETSRHLSRNR